MWGEIIGGALGAGANLLGGLMGRKTQKKQQQRGIRTAKAVRSILNPMEGR